MKKTYRFLMIPLLILIGVCGCTSEPATENFGTSSSNTTTTAAAETLIDTESGDSPATLASQEEVVEIVGDLLDRERQLAQIFYFQYQEARDENGQIITYQGEDFVLEDSEESRSGGWSELVEFGHTKAELTKMTEDLFTEPNRAYYLYYINAYYHEENGKIYKKQAEGGVMRYSYYPETLEIMEQTDCLVSIECKGYNETYEQQFIVSLTAIIDGGVWKIDALSMR